MNSVVVYPKIQMGGFRENFPYIHGTPMLVPMSEQSDYGLKSIMDLDWIKKGEVFFKITSETKRGSAEEWLSRYPMGIPESHKRWAEVAHRMALELVKI